MTTTINVSLTKLEILADIVNQKAKEFSSLALSTYPNEQYKQYDQAGVQLQQAENYIQYTAVAEQNRLGLPFYTIDLDYLTKRLGSLEQFYISSQDSDKAALSQAIANINIEILDVKTKIQNIKQQQFEIELPDDISATFEQFKLI